MNGIHVTSHAISRYRERVELLPEAEVRARLSTDAFRTAAEIGAQAVILPSGHRAVVEGNIVVTVRPKMITKSRRKREIEE